MKIERIKNLTGHRVILKDTDGHFKVFNPEPQKAMVKHEMRTVKNNEELPFVGFKEFVDPKTMPSYEEGTLLIVSGKVFYNSAMSKRYDLLTPYKIERNKQGEAMYCTAFKTKAYY
jgi:hypothetical protein